MALLAGVSVRPAVAAPILTSGSFATPPVSVGGNHICALPGDGTVLCWGDNTFGQIGNGRVTDPNAPAGDVLVQQTVVADAAGAGGGDCVDVTDDGAVIRCHGGASLTDVTAIAAGYSHTCALLVDTTVTCWGSNAPIDGGQLSPSLSGGELGDGSTTARPVPGPVIAGPGQTAPLSGVRSLSAAAGYTCALLDDGTAKCWGNAPQAFSSAPITVMADATTPLTQILAISSGDQNACAALLDGSVVCWGGGLLGDQRSDTQRDGSLPVKVTVAGAPTTNLGGIKALTLGHNVFIGPNGFAMGHSCAMNASAEVVCWGWNDVSQLGNGFNMVTGGFDSQRDYAVPVIAAPGSSDLLRRVTAIAAGGYSTCALIDDGSVKCWGLGFGGDSFEGAGAPVPLEVGATTTATADGGIALADFRRASVQTAAAPIANAVGIAAGGLAGICVVLADGSLSCSDGDNGMASVPGVAIAAPSPPATPTPAPGATQSTAPASTPSGPQGGSTDIDGLAGTWNVTYGAAVTVSVAFANGIYTVTTTDSTAIAGTTCSVPAGTVMETFAGSGGEYHGEQALFGPTCQFANWVPLTGHRDGSGAVTILYTGHPGRHVLVPAGSTAGPSIFRNSIPTPSQVNLDLATVVIPTLVAGVVIIVLVPFPGSLFNSTLRTNYAELMRRGRRARRRIRNTVLRPWFALAGGRSIARGPRPIPIGEEEPILSPPPVQAQRHDFWWTWPGVGIFVLTIAVVSSFLDPGFWFDAASVPTFIGMLVGLVVVMVAFDLPSIIYYRRSNTRFWFRALPGTLFVALACLAISRLTDFHPGYLYGLVITIAAAANLGLKVEGRLLAAGVIVTLVVAVVAWFALEVVTPLARASSDPMLVGVQTVLSMLVSDGVQGTAFGLLPLSFLAGHDLRKWNPWVHAGLWLFSLAAFGIVILNPQNGYLSDTTRTPLLTIVVLFALFSIGSVWFWRYFRGWHRRMSKYAPIVVEEVAPPAA